MGDFLVVELKGKGEWVRYLGTGAEFSLDRAEGKDLELRTVLQRTLIEKWRKSTFAVEIEEERMNIWIQGNQYPGGSQNDGPAAAK